MYKMNFENIRTETAEFNSTGVLYFILKWRKPLAIISAASLILSYVACLFITPKFKSSVILFPSSTSSVSKALLSEVAGNKQDLLQFGEEAEAEQLLQVLQSDDIRDAVIKKFNLLDHYKIDPESKFRQTQLFDKYDDNINFKRTEFMSVKIEVMDTDPQMAADIANSIAALYDSTKNSIQRQRSLQGLKMVEAKYLDFKREMQADEDSLNRLRALGINDYESQAERLNEAYGKALLEGKQSAIRILEEKMALLSKFGGAYVSIRDNFEHKRKQLAFLKSKYEEAKMDAEQNIPHKFVVNYAHKAERKSYPVTWLVMVVSAMCTFLCAVLALIIIDKARKTDFTYKMIKKDGF